MKKPELSPEERALLAELEPIVRNAVWNTTSKVYEGPLVLDGKWIEYPLRHPTKKDYMGKPVRHTLKAENTSEEFWESACAFGTNQLHTSLALYRILRALKQRKLLNVPGFDRWDA